MRIMKKDIYVERENLKSAVNLLRTEFNSLQGAIKEQEGHLQAIARQKELQGKEMLDRLEFGKEELNKNQKQFAVEKARMKVVFEQDVAQKRENQQKGKALEAISEELGSKEINLEVREKDCHTTMLKNQETAHNLQTQGIELESIKNLLNKREDGLDEQQHILENLQSMLKKREENNWQAEQGIDKREKQLDSRETNLLRIKEAQVIQAKKNETNQQAIVKKLQDIDKTEKALVLRNEELDVRQEKLTKQEKVIADETKNASAREIELAKLHSVLLEKQSDIKERARLQRLKDKGII